MSLLAPSLLAADFSKLGAEAEEATLSGADLMHIDVMDGHFVPNISFGAAVMRSLDGCETAPYDVHLMITGADRYMDEFVTAKTQFITVHQEACVHLDRMVRRIRDAGVRAGIALNPATPLRTLECVLGEADLVLVMSVNPGFGGQEFIPYTLDKVKGLAEMRRLRGLNFLIEVDGGVTQKNAPQLLEAGADILVAGSAVFRGNIADNVKAFKKIQGGR